MTSVNGLRLAYRGFVTGLAAGYAWLATAMVLAALIHAEPLAPLRPLAELLAAGVQRGSPEATAFVLGFALVQLSAGCIGMLFAYFFARFFTARSTLAAAAPCFALLVWALIAATVGPLREVSPLAPLLASLAYGVLLGAGLPLRGDVLRPGRSAA